MKILGYLSHAWPTQRGGSETSAHAVLSWLASRGHDVRCLVIRHRGSDVDGVEYAQRSARGQSEWWDWCDVAISQQGASTNASRFGEHHNRPVVHWAHGWDYLTLHLDELHPSDMLAYNSEALHRSEGHRWSGRSMVLHPPTFPDRYPQSEGAMVAQVNLSALKGGRMFWDLAAALPDVQFLGVGGWGEQVTGHADNATVIPTTQHMIDDVYSRTRVLIVPTRPVSESQSGESWGMVAAEAAASGITVIAAPSPGLIENLGDGAYWCDPDNLGEWVDAITDALGSDRPTPADLRDPTIELEALEAHLSEMCGALV